MQNVLKGKKVAITSGPTRAPIDAVRFISNRSTGGLGASIAEVCYRRGAEVTLFHGVGSDLPLHWPGIRIVEIETVDHLVTALERKLPDGGYDVFFHAMAVLDYVPAKALKEKIPSGKASLTLRLVKTPKVINLIKQLSPETILVGFKLEVGVRKDELVRRATKMMRSSNSDFVLANDLRTVHKKQHTAYVLDAAGQLRGPFKGKKTIATSLVDIVTERLSEDPERSTSRGAQVNQDKGVSK
jgi:phosphopantothenoylcysteine synthetase/decarboxylase